MVGGLPETARRRRDVPDAAIPRIDGNVGDQTRRCLDNLTAVCAAAGAQLTDAVRMTVYAADLAGDWAEINEAYATYFGDGPPARVAIQPPSVERSNDCG